jgi:hypothetical protein
MKLSASMLAVSAFAITALAIIEAGRLHPTANAGDSSMGFGGYTVVTSGTSEGADASPVEVLYVLDNRNESLLVYSIEPAPDRRLSLRGGGSLPALFRAARGG